MKKFLFDTAVFLSISILILFGIFSFAGGTTDNYYRNFTSSKQNSLALGSSIAQFAIIPKVLNPILFEDSENQLFNYSFYLGTTYYGPTYLESVKKKLDPRTQNGVFILTVDPWLLSNSSNKPDAEASFAEKGGLLDKMHFVNLKPNFEYLLFHYSNQYISIIERWLNPTHMYLHVDGWLESDPDRGPRSDYTVEEKKKWQLELYQNNTLIDDHSVSDLRDEYLEKTIQFFQNHGEVYLVRLPVHSYMDHIEDQYDPNFDERITELAVINEVEYLSFRDFEEEFIYYDINHLMPKSAVRVSNLIGKWISDHRSK